MDTSALNERYANSIVNEIPPLLVAAIVEKVMRDKLVKAVEENPHEPGKAVNELLEQYGANGPITQRLRDEFGAFTVTLGRTTTADVYDVARRVLERRENKIPELS